MHGTQLQTHAVHLLRFSVLQLQTACCSQKTGRWTLAVCVLRPQVPKTPVHGDRLTPTGVSAETAVRHQAYLQRHRLGLVVQKSDHHLQRQCPSPSLLIEPAMPALNVVISPHLLAVAGEVGWRPRAVLQPRRLHVLQQLDNSSGTRRHGGRKCVEGWPHMARRQ